MTAKRRGTNAHAHTHTQPIEFSILIFFCTPPNTREFSARYTKRKRATTTRVDFSTLAVLNFLSAKFPHCFFFADDCHHNDDDRVNYILFFCEMMMMMMENAYRKSGDWWWWWGGAMFLMSTVGSLRIFFKNEHTRYFIFTRCENGAVGACKRPTWTAQPTRKKSFYSSPNSLNDWIEFSNTTSPPHAHKFKWRRWSRARCTIVWLRATRARVCYVSRQRQKLTPYVTYVHKTAPVVLNLN